MTTILRTSAKENDVKLRATKKLFAAGEKYQVKERCSLADYYYHYYCCYAYHAFLSNK